jgi:Transposase DDE domain
LGLIQDERYFSAYGLSRRTRNHNIFDLYGILQMKIQWEKLFYTLAKTMTPSGEWFLILDSSPLSQPYAKFRITKHGFVNIQDQKRVPHNQIVSLIMTNGLTQIVLDYRIWTSPKVARQADYRKQTDLALDLIKRSALMHLPVKTVFFDSFFASKAIISWLNKHHYIWVTRLKGNRIVFNQGQASNIQDLNMKSGDTIQAELKDIRSNILIRCIQYQDETVYVATNGTDVDGPELERRYRLRWKIEEFHREAKQQLGLEYLWMRNYRALYNHVGFVCLAYSLLSILQTGKKRTIGTVKRSIQDELYSTHDGIDRFTQKLIA